MNAKVLGLTRFPQSGAPGEPLDQAKLVAGMGMEGDMHQGGERPLSLLSAETRLWMEAQTEKGLCFKKFRENILIEGLCMEDLSQGCRLSVGETLLQISVSRKPCFDNCERFSKGIACRLSQGALFAAVLQSGRVQIGDPVFVQDEELHPAP